jgi:hypothetical protein
MTRRAMAALLFCLAVALFLSRYVFALWYRGSKQTSWGPDDFAGFLGYIGIAPWVLAFGFLIAGIIYLILSERER